MTIPMSLKSYLSRFLLIIGGLLLPLLMLEIGVRLWGAAPPPIPNPSIWQPHPLFGWWHVPYSGGIFHSDFNEFAADVRINARGLRDREIGYDNPRQAWRVLSLADSFGEALQVDLEATYHKQLQRRLADTLDQPVEVINAGVGGWGTDQQAIFYLAEGFRYQPQVVLLAFFVRNDAVNNYGPLEIARNGGSQQKQFFSLSPTGELIPPPVEQPPATVEPAVPLDRPAVATEPTGNHRWGLPVADLLWQMSALYRFGTPYLRDIPPVVQYVGPTGLLGGEGIIRAGHPTTPIPFLVYQEPPDESFEAAWQLTEAIILRLHQEVRQRGAALVVVLIAAPEQVYPAEGARLLARYPTLAAKSWNLELPNQRLTRFLTAEQIPHVDLLPVFREAATDPTTPPLHFRHDQHWTPAGHQLAAETIHGFLIEELDVP